MSETILHLNQNVEQLQSENQALKKDLENALDTIEQNKTETASDSKKNLLFAFFFFCQVYKVMQSRVVFDLFWISIYIYIHTLLFFFLYTFPTKSLIWYIYEVLI